MLKAGFARLDVTPPLENVVSGYFELRIANGVLDPLYVNAVAVGNEKETLIMMAVDYIGIRMPYCVKIRELISKRTGIPTDHIYIAALHQHTAICISDPTDKRFGAADDSLFLDVAIRKIADAAVMAVDDMKPATLSTGARETEEPIAFVRRCFTKNHGVQMNPSEKYEVLGRCAEADNTVRVVRFTREDANDIAIINFSTHPDVIGGKKYSADWPGFARKLTEEKIPGVSTVFFVGCQGDSNHFDYLIPKSQRKTGYAHSRHMGDVISNAVKAMWDSMTERHGDDIFAEHRVIYNATNLDGIEKYDECVKWQDDFVNGRLTYEPETAEKGYVSRIIALRSSPVFRPVPITVVKFADVIFAGFGGEPFTAFGEYMRSLAKDCFVVCTICTNGYEGYLPTKEAFKQGGYEVASSLFTPTVTDEILDTVKDIIKNM